MTSTTQTLTVQGRSRLELTAAVATAFLVIVVLAAPPAHGSEMTVLEQLNAHTMLEATTNGYFMIQQEYGLDPTSTATWSGTYDEEGWSSTLTGTLYARPLRVDFSGKATSAADAVTIAFTGTGLNEPDDQITIEGSAIWYYDAPTATYTHMDYEDSGLVETPVLKWWHKALEAVGGGIIGGLAGGIGGVLGGAAAGVSLSEAIFESTTDGSDPPEPPGVGALPVVPDWDATLTYVPESDEIITRVLGDGTLNANVRDFVTLAGDWDAGLASGTAAVVPEPFTLSLLILGGGMGLLKKRGWRRRR